MCFGTGDAERKRACEDGDVKAVEDEGDMQFTCLPAVVSAIVAMMAVVSVLIVVVVMVIVLMGLVVVVRTVVMEAVVLVVVMLLGADMHTVRDIDPAEPLNISRLLFFDRTQEAPQSCWLNDSASLNMPSM